MTWFTALQVSITNGTVVVTVNSGESIANVQPGDALIVGSFSPVEIKRAYINGASEQLIELVGSWNDSTQTTVAARVFPTSGDFAAAVSALKNATKVTSDNFKALESFGTQPSGTVDFVNQDGSIQTVKSAKQMEKDHANRLAQVDASQASSVRPRDERTTSCPGRRLAGRSSH